MMAMDWPRRRHLVVHLVDQVGAVDERHRAAFLGQVDRHGAADALRRAGDDGDLGGEAAGMMNHDDTTPIDVTTPLLANFSK